MKAKNVTLIAQIIAAVWIAGWHVYKFIVQGIQTHEVILSGIVIAACFLPVYFNMFLDKIKDIRFGGSNENNKEVSTE